jgi:glycosyltransferase involved in cell wall biosynthesis
VPAPTLGDARALAAALRRLRDDAALRERLGYPARETAAGSMTSERMAEQWLGLWEELLGAPRAPRVRLAPLRP